MSLIEEIQSFKPFPSTSQFGLHEWFISLAVLYLKSPSKSYRLFKLYKYIALLLSNLGFLSVSFFVIIFPM